MQPTDRSTLHTFKYLILIQQYRFCITPILQIKQDTLNNLLKNSLTYTEYKTWNYPLSQDMK